MCAAPNSHTQQSKQSSEKSMKTSSKPEPKWLKMKRLNKSSADKTEKPTGKTSSSAQKANQQTRKKKRDRWAKKSKPVAKPAARRRGPVFEYVSSCCGIPCQKTPCGTKIPTVDPESGKAKEKVTGLGTWRCNGVGGCKKTCKVTRKAPAAKVADAIPGSTVQPTLPVEEAPNASA